MGSFPKQLTCAVTAAPFQISAFESSLRESLAPTIGGRPIPWPAPRLSPEERQRRRLAFRNERVLYRNKSALSGKPIISSYSPDKSLRVLAREEWLEADNTQFGRPFDFNRPFFEQFAELMRDTYKPNVVQDGEMPNSEYCHFCGWSKNCYLMFDSGKNQDCAYGVLNGYCKNSFDCFYCFECEICFDCVKVHNGYELFHSQHCSNCSFSAYLTDCVGCKNCIACTNLRNKEYYAFNKPVGKAEFKRIWAEYFCGSQEKSDELAVRYAALLAETPRRALRNINCVDVSGDLLTSCVEAYDCYNLANAKNCCHVHDCIEIEHCLDISNFGEGMQHCYELSGSGGARGKSEVSNCYASWYIYYGGYNIFYSASCHQNCKDLFGCNELNRKQYCILNKQYSAAEYETLLPQIVEHMHKTGEWGEFFPIGLSPYGYNESLAQESLPLSKSEALALGAHWSDYEAPAPAAAGHSVLICSTTRRPFRLVEQEIEFRRLHALPLPQLHPEERQRLRSLRFNSRKLLRARCAKTNVEIETTYRPEQRMVVYSESAYREVCD